MTHILPNDGIKYSLWDKLSAIKIFVAKFFKEFNFRSICFDEINNFVCPDVGLFSITNVSDQKFIVIPVSYKQIILASSKNSNIEYLNKIFTIDLCNYFAQKSAYELLFCDQKIKISNVPIRPNFRLTNNYELSQK